jgi:hypothetical protein
MGVTFDSGEDSVSGKEDFVTVFFGFFIRTLLPVVRDGGSEHIEWATETLESNDILADILQ